MSPDIRWKQRFENYKKALLRFEEAVNGKTEERLQQEGLIQRFEYTFELAWKCLQDVLQERGFAEIRGPKPVIQQSLEDGLIHDGLLWMDMLKSRNEASHIYDEDSFLDIYHKAKQKYLAPLVGLRQKLEIL